MISQLEKEIIFRFLKARKKDGFLNVISIFSFIGIGLGVAVLIIVMSVMNGFRTELVNRILGINGHLMIFSNEGVYMDDYNKVIKQIINLKDVLAVTPQVEGQALAKSKDFISGVIVRGVRWSDLPTKKLLWKSLSNEAKENYKEKNEVLIGYRLARKLNVKTGDKITLFSANGVVTALGTIPQKKSFVIGGLFDVGMYEYDNNFIFLPWERGQSFLFSFRIMLFSFLLFRLFIL